MKSIAFVLTLGLFIVGVIPSAQAQEKTPGEAPTFKVVEEMPEFPGGER
jgi:hypothetical protein